MTQPSPVARQASDALWRARRAIAMLSDRTCTDRARQQLAEAIVELRLAGVSVDDLAVVLSLPESTIRRLLLTAAG